MGLFDKLERRLESGVNGAFAKAFRAEVQPVELASALRRAMDDRATSVGKGKRPIVPNLFDIELSPTDYAHLTEYESALVDELKASAAEHAETQRYTPGGPLAISFSQQDELETGVFKVRPQIARQTTLSNDPASTQAPTQARTEMHPGSRGDEHSSTEQARPLDEPDGGWYSESVQEQPHRPPGGFALPGFGRRRQEEAPVDRSEHDTSDAPAQQYQHLHQPYDEPDQPAEPVPEPERHHQPMAPSPAAPRSFKQRPYLDIDGDRYPLMGAITVLGRDDAVDIALDDTGVSRRHSEIRVTNDGPHLVASLSDLGSTNGTFLNGERITSVHLDDGDRITIGRTSLIFRLGSRR